MSESVNIEMERANSLIEDSPSSAGALPNSDDTSPAASTPYIDDRSAVINSTLKKQIDKKATASLFMIYHLAITIVFCSWVSSALAFDSYGIVGVTGGAIHGKITEDATKRMGINDCDKLQEAIRFPDWEQTSVHRLKLRPNNLYIPSNHFDRMAGKSHAQAFKEGAYFVRTEHEKCIRFAQYDKFDASLASLGRVLHAVQDFVSHSNVIDLPESKQQETLKAIWDDSLVLPIELMLTGYDATDSNPGKPLGDQFSHDDFSKDNPNKNAEAKLIVQGKSKYKIAYGFAVDQSEQILTRTKEQLGRDDWLNLVKEFD